MVVCNWVVIKVVIESPFKFSSVLATIFGRTFIRWQIVRTKDAPTYSSFGQSALQSGLLSSRPNFQPRFRMLQIDCQYSGKTFHIWDFLPMSKGLKNRTSLLLLGQELQFVLWESIAVNYIKGTSKNKIEYRYDADSTKVFTFRSQMSENLYNLASWPR